MDASVLITGCYGGIGRSLVDAFASDGWNVIGVERPGGVTASDTNGGVIEGDIAQFASDAGALAGFGAEVRARSKAAPLSCIVNNAAVQTLGRLDRLSASAIAETMNVNVIAPMLLVKEFLPELAARKGSVVNIGSVHAQATKPGFAAYATSKAALHGLTRALAVDLGPDVRVNTLAPAATATPMLEAGFAGDEAGYAALKGVHPLQRIAEPEEIARMALYLASDDAAFVTGATFYADGGVLSRLHDPA